MNSDNSSGNSNAEGAAAAPLAAAGKKVVDKRKDIIGDIKTRLNTSYNVDKNFKKNEKQLAAKVKFFEDKMAKGAFKEFMRPRMVEAQTLLERVRGLKTTPLAAKAAVPAPSPAKTIVAPPMARPAAAAAVAPAKSRSGAKSQKKNKGNGAATPAGAGAGKKTLKLPAGFDKVAAELMAVAKKQEEDAKKLEKTFATLQAAMQKAATKKGALAPIAEVNENAERNSQIVDEYLVEASQKYLPLPEFYDPYTGRKFNPGESPMTPIERAYKQLKKIHKRAHRNARTLRSAAAAADAGRARRNTRRRKH